MNKRDFILKYIEMNNNKIDIKEATEDIDVLFHTLKNVLIAQGKVSFFKRGTFEVFERKGRIIGNPRTKEPMELPSELTIRFRASPNLNKLFNKK
ncbi:HU family DNA-binding protein [uncultured Fusobacterium sp.]|uniref:HU family DNA-binding protein n=1 Tax=uncultured Fusobacterium sp. TaxID=159267 RepID=UPI0025D01361|nr:HU family DNA-binding protein [uncultured Fusobacterium sp.]